MLLLHCFGCDFTKLGILALACPRVVSSDWECTGQEGSDTVAVVKAFIPDKWRAGSATSAPVCAATSLNFTAVCEEDADFQASPEPTSQVGTQERYRPISLA